MSEKIDEKLNQISKQINDLKSKEKALKKKKKAEEKLKKDKMIYKIGSIMLSMKIDTPQKAELLLNEYNKNPKCKNWIDTITTSNITETKKSDI